MLDFVNENIWLLVVWGFERVNLKNQGVRIEDFKGTGYDFVSELKKKNKKIWDYSIIR